MLLLQLTLLFVLVLGADSSEDIYLYHRAGDEVVLPFNSVDSSETSCSFCWIYNRNVSSIVRNGEIEKDSPQAAKLSLGRRCSLTITNISSEDAGRYTCFNGDELTSVFLIVSTPDSSRFIYLYHRAGDEVVLPCNIVDSSRTSCFWINWLYYRNISSPDFIVRDGRIEKNSTQAAKLSLGRRCSLTITNISSEDAGHYICVNVKEFTITHVFLIISTLSADQSIHPEGGVTLTCSLRRNKIDNCERGSLLLLDEESAELERKDEDTPGKGCLSFLTITHQSNHSRQYTCKFVTDDEVKISTNYTLVSTGDLTSDSTPKEIIFIIIGATAALLTILVVVGLTVFIKSKRRTGAAEDAQDGDRVPDEQDSSDL